MMQNETPITPGLIILFGSGETLPSRGLAYDFLARKMTSPLDISFHNNTCGFLKITPKKLLTL